MRRLQWTARGAVGKTGQLAMRHVAAECVLAAVTKFPSRITKNVSEVPIKLQKFLPRHIKFLLDLCMHCIVTKFPLRTAAQTAKEIQSRLKSAQTLLVSVSNFVVPSCVLFNYHAPRF